MALDMHATARRANVAALDHVNIVTEDVEACRRFYVDVLGFEEGFRPPFDTPGLWLYLGEVPALHIVEVREAAPRNSGSIDHIAFRARNFDEFAARLEAHGIVYEDCAVPAMALHQIFCHDPHGIKIELNFEGRERPWATLEAERAAMRAAESAS